MNNHWSVGAFRNTSNADYGKFLYALNPTSITPQQCGQVSSTGDRVFQHLHYPNCPHRNSESNQPQQETENATGAMPEYTIEYGEDAVRKALGGNMPDFQAQFEKQYGNGSGDYNNFGPQNVQMTGDGQKIAMVPVIFVNEDENGEASGQQNASMGQEQTSQNSEGGKTKTNEEIGTGSNSQNTAASSNAAPTPVQSGKGNAKGLKPENILNAFDLVQKIRTPNYCGRHIRPSYLRNPNPCRKKVYGGEESMGKMNEQDPMMNNSYAMPMGDMTMMGNGSGAYEQMMMLAQQSAQQEEDNKFPPSPPRARSLPAKPRAKLCMRCKKCKNLDLGIVNPSTLAISDNPNGSTLKPKGLQPLNPHRRQLVLPSSSSQHLSAKNFRDIRFASNI